MFYPPPSRSEFELHCISNEWNRRTNAKNTLSIGALTRTQSQSQSQSHISSNPINQIIIFTEQKLVNDLCSFPLTNYCRVACTTTNQMYALILLPRRRITFLVYCLDRLENQAASNHLNSLFLIEIFQFYFSNFKFSRHNAECGGGEIEWATDDTDDAASIQQG